MTHFCMHLAFASQNRLTPGFANPLFLRPQGEKERLEREREREYREVPEVPIHTEGGGGYRRGPKASEGTREAHTGVPRKGDKRGTPYIEIAGGAC